MPDTKGFSSKAAAFPGGHAVVIGVANYLRIGRLPVSVLDDARDVASVLLSHDHCGYDAANVRLLLDDEATLAGIRQALAGLATACGPDDTAVVFFSGHGGLLGNPGDPISALLPVDFDPAARDATGFLEAEFSSALEKIPAKRLVVLLDACHSGGAGSFKAPGVPDAIPYGFSEKSLAHLAQGTGRVLIASSRASEVSYVLPGARNSVFTQHLLDALRGRGRTTGDGLIRVFEIFTHLSEQVVRSAPGPQHPILKASDLEENFAIALDRGGIKSVSGPSTEPGRDRDLASLLSDLYPSGPRELEIWERAGGDLSRLHLTGTGRAMWFSALRTLDRGGGGAHISKQSVIAVALEDYPRHTELVALAL